MNLARWTQRAAAVLILVASVSEFSSAQDSVATSKPPRSCWRGQPLPVCSTILLTEFGVYRDLVTPSARRRSFAQQGDLYEVRDSNWDLQAELGLLRNINEKYGLGGSVLLRYNNQEGTSLGLKARYRHWLTPSGVSLDLGAGVRASRDPAPPWRQNSAGGYEYPSYGRAPTFTTDAALNLMDYASVVARTDLVKMGGVYEPKLSVGVRGGSRVGTFGFAGFGTTIAILAAIFIATFET